MRDFNCSNSSESSTAGDPGAAASAETMRERLARCFCEAEMELLTASLKVDGIAPRPEALQRARDGARADAAHLVGGLSAAVIASWEAQGFTDEQIRAEWHREMDEACLASIAKDRPS